MSYYPLSGLGTITQAAAGFGQIDFNAASVWSDWKAGGASGAQAAKMVQAALNQLGYGPLAVDGQFGAGSLSAWGRFAKDFGTGDAAWPTQVGITKLGEALVAGGTPGGGPAVTAHMVGGQIVPGAAPMSTGAKVALGVAAAVLVGGGVYLVVKKRKQHKVASGVVARAKEISRQAVTNRRRRRYRARR